MSGSQAGGGGQCNHSLGQWSMAPVAACWLTSVVRSRLAVFAPCNLSKTTSLSTAFRPAVDLSCVRFGFQWAELD